MDDERLVVEVEKYVELYDQSSRHYKDNSKKVIAWRAIALEIGFSEVQAVKSQPGPDDGGQIEDSKPSPPGRGLEDQGSPGGTNGKSRTLRGTHGH
ncbi:unnamed protein product [Boreogadus saida]